MWAATTDGFYSVATDRTDPTLRHVRTWDRGDCDRFLEWYATWAQQLVGIYAEQGLSDGPAIPDATITTYEGSDYPWRVIVPQGAWSTYLAEKAEDMDYDRFKPAVEEAQGRDRHDLYERVFFLLATLEHDDPQGRERPYVAAPPPKCPHCGGVARFGVCSQGHVQEPLPETWDDLDDWLERHP